MKNEPEQPALELPPSSVTPVPEATPLPPIAGGKPKSALIAVSETGVSLKTMEDVFIFAKAVMDSQMAPKGFDTPQKILVAIQMGMELGLSPMASLSNVAVINGRPTLWGDAVPGVCNASGKVEDYKDEQIGADESYGYRVTIKRRDRSEPVARTFTVSMAKKAGLWGKQGPWTQYPERMLLMRARTYAYRDSFPEALRGIPTYEEARDHPEMTNVTPKLDELDQPKTS